MPFWRKKNQDFEWQKYVRTTVLMRRKQRRQKLEDAGAAAVFGIRQAKWKSLAHMKAAAAAVGRGSAAGARMIRDGSKASIAYGWPRLKSGAHATKRGINSGGRSTASAIAHAGCATATGLKRFYSGQIQPALQTGKYQSARIIRPLLARIANPQIFGPLCVVTLAAGFGAVVNLIQKGFTSDALLVSGLAVALTGLVVAAWPTGAVVTPDWSKKISFARVLPATSRGWALTGGSALLMVLCGSALWYARDDVTGIVNLPEMALPDFKMPDLVPNFEVSAINPFKSEQITGRAKAIDGGHLRIGKQTLRLDNIDFLPLSQTCKTSRGRTWRCGRRAQSRLRRLVRRRTLTCTINGQDSDGIKRATCTAGENDIGAMLVAEGYAFANIGIFASYRDAEKKAREEKSGIWQGSAERPSDFRMSRWQKAAQKSPDGCPIKGRVLRRGKLYVLPWDRGYDRVRIRTRRGEKWFCKEDEAIAAGFRHSSQI